MAPGQSEPWPLGLSTKIRRRGVRQPRNSELVELGKKVPSTYLLTNDNCVCKIFIAQFASRFRIFVYVQRLPRRDNSYRGRDYDFFSREWAVNVVLSVGGWVGGWEAKR